jgi:signal transduction histidine kinase
MTSIRKQLLWTVVVSQALLAGGMVFAGVFYTQRRLDANLEAALQSHAVSVAALVRFPEDGGHDLIFESGLLPSSIDPARPDLFEIRAEGMGVIARSANWPASLTVDCRNSSASREFHVSGIPYRGLCQNDLPILDREEGQTASPPRLSVFYAAPMIEVRRQVRAAGVYIALASLLLLGGTISLALWGVRRGLLPLQQMAEKAGRVTAQNWEFSSPADADLTAELQPLTRAMETMLGRLRESFEQQREFMGNAAHELKTPVTILKSTLQTLLQKPRTSEEYQAGVGRALEDMERLEKLLQWMLRLARAEQWARGMLRRELGPVDLASTCEDAIAGVQPLAEARHTQIRFTAEASAICRADPEDLALIWVNLLENAVRYSPEGATVTVKVGGDGNGRARVLFEDHGPGISEEELPHIFERFHRGDRSRARETGGFGLGLAIANALVEAYGGTITATSTLGQGTQMSVELPSYSSR